MTTTPRARRRSSPHCIGLRSAPWWTAPVRLASTTPSALQSRTVLRNPSPPPPRPLVRLAHILHGNPVRDGHTHRTVGRDTLRFSRPASRSFAYTAVFSDCAKQASEV